MIYCFNLILSIFLLFPLVGENIDYRNFYAKVVGVKDGDTVVLLVDQQQLVVRLADIDCPEKNQPYGKAAKAVCSDLCYGKTVQVKSGGKLDRYKRLVAYIYVDRRVSVNEMMIMKGYAWQFLKYSKSSHLHNLEMEARNKRMGLWADPNPVPPWVWRKSK